MPIDPKKHEMPVQDPQVRAYNFNEVALGYTHEMALAEASRCLDCKNSPCRTESPSEVSFQACGQRKGQQSENDRPFGWPFRCLSQYL